MTGGELDGNVTTTGHSRLYISGGTVLGSLYALGANISSWRFPAAGIGSEFRLAQCAGGGPGSGTARSLDPSDSLRSVVPCSEWRVGSCREHSISRVDRANVKRRQGS